MIIFVSRSEDENEGRFYLIVPDLNGGVDFVKIFDLYVYFVTKSSLTCSLLFPVTRDLLSFVYWTLTGSGDGPPSNVRTMSLPCGSVLSSRRDSIPVSRPSGLSGSSDLKSHGLSTLDVSLGSLDVYHGEHEVTYTRLLVGLHNLSCSGSPVVLDLLSTIKVVGVTFQSIKYLVVHRMSHPRTESLPFLNRDLINDETMVDSLAFSV